MTEEFEGNEVDRRPKLALALELIEGMRRLMENSNFMDIKIGIYN
jgi:hypothetical protein